MKQTIYHAVSVFAVILFAFSSIISGTLGWRSLNQSAQNETHQSVNDSWAELIKLEKKADGTLTEIAVPEAVFSLFTEDGKQIGSLYHTDKNGKIKVELPPGSYYFEEISPPLGYDFDTESGKPKTRYPFKVTGEEIEAVQVKAYNLRHQGTLSVQKQVENADGSPLTEAQKEQLFTFTVTFSDDRTYSYSVDGGERQTIRSGGILTLKHGQTAVFLDIPVGVQYHIVETVVPGYAISATGQQGNITEDGCAAVFKNTYDPNLIGSLTVTKEVAGAGANLQKEFSFTAVINGKTETFVLKHGESKIFPNLPVGTEYTITETDYTTNGYVAAVGKYSGVVIAGEEILLPFFNHYGEAGLSGSLEISKEVLGEHADPNKEFTFTVTFSDGGTYSYRIDGGEPQELKSGGMLTLKHGQAAVFENLPHEVTYFVTETGTEGYIPLLTSQMGTIIGGRTVKVAFRNKVQEIKPETKLEVTKVLEGEYPETDADKEFHFTLVLNGKKTEFVLHPGETMSFEVHEGDWYEVTEDQYFPDGYSLTMIDGVGVIMAGGTKVTAINTYVGRGTVEVKGEKTWVLNEAYPVTIPDSIIVRLKYGEVLVEEQVVHPDKNGEWHYSFHAPKYDASGNEIQYTVEEVPVDHFVTTYDGWNIINTYMPPVELHLPVIEKSVVGENVPNTRFEFWLKGEEEAPMPEGSAGNVKVVTIDGDGLAELGTILFSRPGVYTYTLTELNSGAVGWSYDRAVYTLTIRVVEDNGVLSASLELTKDGEPVDAIVFENHYDTPKPTEDTVTVEGKKTWVHGDNPKESRPQFIIVYVYADGELLLQQRVSAKENWAYAFTLPKNARDGHEISYTVSEAEVENYQMAVNGYDLVNVYHPVNSGTPGASGNLPTGDTGNMVFWFALMGISLAGMIISLIIINRKRKK